MREMFLSEGFTDYLTKPIDYVRLEQMLLKYIPAEKIEEDRAERIDENVDLPEALLAIQELDVSAGIKNCGGAKSYLDTLRMYSDAGRKNAEEIRAFWKVRDIRNLTIKIHALKSTSRVIGAYGVGELAADLERAGRLDRPGLISADLEKFLFSYTELAAKLTPLFEPIDESKEGNPLKLEESGQHSLLLVDDDPLYQKMVRGWLSETYKVAAVKSGAQAIKYLGSHTPDLILLDCEMPQMSGPEVFERLKADPSTADIPVFFLTGASERESIESIESTTGRSPEGYLLKTMDRDSILGEIKVFFDETEEHS